MKSTLSSALSAGSPELSRTAAAIDAIQSLRRGISRAGGFALFVAVCNDPSEWDRLIDILGQALPDRPIRAVRLSATTDDPLDAVLRQVPQPAGPLLLLGLEEAVSLRSGNETLLTKLNLGRPHWAEKIPEPVVLGVSEALLPVVARKAADFLDWRSDTVVIPELSDAEVAQVLSQTVRGAQEERASRRSPAPKRVSLQEAREHALSILREFEEERRLLALQEAERDSWEVST